MPSRPSAQHVVSLEPGLHLIPGVLGGLLAVARATVGVEAMRGARIDLELSGLFVFLQRRLQRFDARDGNAGIGLAIEAEHRCLHLGTAGSIPDNHAKISSTYRKWRAGKPDGVTSR